MLNIVTELLERGLETRHFDAFFSKPSRTTRVKIFGISKQYKDETVNIFLKRSIRQLFSYYQNRRKSTFLSLRKIFLTGLTIYFCTGLFFLAKEIRKF